MKREETTKITIAGREYPCRQTMGAMLRFKRETGREVSDMEAGLTDLCTYLYCCVASASAADGADFRMTLTQFADALSPEELQAWAETLSADGDPDGPDGEEVGANPPAGAPSL